MHLQLANTPHYAVAMFDGELDEGCVKEVRNKIDEFIRNNKFSHFVFDFSRLTFMDSTGIGMLLGRYKILKQMDIPIYISKANRHVDFILSTAGIYSIMQKIS